MITATEMRLASAPSTAVVATEIMKILPLEEFKEEHRVLSRAEDGRITNAIKEAYFRLDGPDGWLRRAILTQTWVGVLDRFDTEIEIPMPPLQAVTGIRYMDEDGAWQTLATSVYGVDTYGLFGRVYLKKDQSFPDIYTDPGSVEITFRCGWGDADDVLSAAIGIRKAMKLLGGHYYYNPTPTFVEPRLVEVPRAVQFGLQHTIGQYRVVSDMS